MRSTLLLIVLLGLAHPASAQENSVPCAPMPGGQVDVETTTQGTLRGTLFCLGATEVSLLRQGERVAVPLSEVKRIEKPADPTWDGAVKGAAVMLTLWGLGCGFCDADSTVWLRGLAGYAIVGATIDALHGGRKTIYAAGPRPMLGWQFRF